MIISSLLDTDLYKLTMMQGVLHQFPGAMVEYAFKCRTPGIDLRPLLKDMTAEINHLCTLRFSQDELDYLRSLRYMKEDFIQFLRIFQLSPEFIHADISSDTGAHGLEITIKGPWLHTILFEVPVLSIISELYGRSVMPDPDLCTARKRLMDKVNRVKQAHADPAIQEPGFVFCDFGTRRRFSRDWQEELVTTLKQELPGRFIGTSNVDLARRLGLTPIGTMAHEWLMAAQALGPRLIDSQRFALEHWVREYRGDLGIALSDVVGFDAFLNDFDPFLAKLFDGCRHDSGDPVEWCEKLIRHYQAIKIDPGTKTAVFSDGLSVASAMDLARRFQGRIRTAFGIGTHLTNDMGGLVETAIQIVIKMTRCQGQPVAKISDSTGKQMCMDDSYLSYLAKVFNLHPAD